MLIWKTLCGLLSVCRMKEKKRIKDEFYITNRQKKTKQNNCLCVCNT
ncbi:hypothetical protein DOY81_003309, partial [Sarcophaga bullata]